MSGTHDSGAVARFVAAYANGDLHGMLAEFEPAASFRDASYLRWSRSSTVSGEGSVGVVGRMVWQAWLQAFPNHSARVVETFDDHAGTVIVELAVEGTQAAHWQAVENAGRSFRCRQSLVFTLSEAGRLSGVSQYYDAGEITRQLVSTTAEKEMPA